MIVENLSALKINKLTREQYDAAKVAGTLKSNELYMTPDIEGADTANTNTVVWSDISIPTSSWVADTTYSSYPYKAALTIKGCNKYYIPEVFPSVAAIELGILAPIAETAADTIYLYATKKPTSTIQISNILLTKNKGSSFVGEDVDPDFIADLKNDINDLMTVVNTKPSYYSYNITLGTSWSSSKTQTVTVEGITADDNPIIDLICSTSGYESEQEEWSKVYKAETLTNGIKFYASEATTKSLNLQVKALKPGEGTSGFFAWKKYKVTSETPN